MQELTVDGQAPGADEEMRTVFNDPTAFNVKHPLYSAWTLWFDSPTTKSRAGGALIVHLHICILIIVGTPGTPSTAVPPTPSGAGWMDDIKKVIRIESVEEFWGYVDSLLKEIVTHQLPDCTIILSSHQSCRKRQTIISSRRVLFQHGKMLRIRMAGSGAFSYPRIRTGTMSTRCGCTRFV